MSLSLSYEQLVSNYTNLGLEGILTPYIFLVITYSHSHGSKPEWVFFSVGQKIFEKWKVTGVQFPSYF